MAAVGRSVQFRGIDKVIQAYDNMQVAPWALYQGTQLLAKSEQSDMEGGKALLSELLNSLDNPDNVATYTLCVFDDLKPGEKIKSGTKWDGSFNFKLADTMQDYKAQRMSGIADNSQRLTAIEEKLERLLNPAPDDDQKPSGVGGLPDFLMEMLDHPQVRDAIATRGVQFIDNIMGFLTRKPAPVVPFVSPSNIPAKVGAAPQAVDSAQMQKIQHALELLMPVDPQLGDHLLTLAEKAHADPAKYQQVIGMLNYL